ncbi:hypothetical protein H5410_047940 [Solanum commersonii]|uniref:Uncharacterized protein n=1 Tax=Solanum commersonii TaxID=4109 RepID=A0A9J5XIJ2_SOLCO|nr:hypothetical protein H5410_047940 [Solanum commersonii]
MKRCSADHPCLAIAPPRTHKALETGLKLGLEKHMMSIEMETDSTEIIEICHHTHPNYQFNEESYMLLLKRLGNPVVNHNSQHGNKLAYFLANEGSKLVSTCTKLAIFENLNVITNDETSRYANIIANKRH